MVKRLGDIAFIAASAIIIVPTVVLLALVVLVSDGRPIFFRQKRIGRLGKPFTLFKLRTLKTDNDPLNPADFVITGGGFMRRFGLDELPQFLNILRGEMSIVGPRPILPAEVQKYDDVQRRRLDVLPGITGWAQTHGRNLLGWEERIQKDLWYVDNASLLLDVQILLMTPAAVFKNTGLYGPGNLDPTESLPSSAEAAEKV
ncbi:MAG: sugar transferase [Rhodothermales bacterium]|nr:sugar transferase [Rhodothermales bacterium]